jgi:MYXO-CTERM domain-containing protein
MRQNKYATQPTAAVFQGANGPIFAVTYALSNPQRAQKQNGHSGGTNITQIKTFDAALNELDYLNGIGPIIGGARHARGWETEYGVEDAAGKASPAIAVLAGSSIGAGAAGYNVVGLDPTTGKLTKTSRDKNFLIANNSDIAGLPTMGKANPQDQAGAFINMVRGSLSNSTTKYPEVTRWSVSFVQGPDKPESETRQHLYLSLVPRAWKPEVKVNPGGAATPSEVPSGPTPTAPPVSDPIEQDPSTSPDQGGTDPVADEEGSDDALGAYGRRGAKASSCSAAAPTSTPTGLAGFALLGLGLILAGKRRKNQKES